MLGDELVAVAKALRSLLVAFGMPAAPMQRFYCQCPSGLGSPRSAVAG